LQLGQEDQQSEVKTTLSHQAPGGSSDQYHKAVLSDRARGLFHGSIKIAKDAAKTNANLLNKNLLLDEGCEINTRPQLEIDTDDVKCSHGATVSQLQAEELFYLQSRGIPAKQARNMLSYAFITEFLQRLEEGPIKEQWTRLLRHSKRILL
jgi:Fe-S cluster assembly protein SufD